MNIAPTLIASTLVVTLHVTDRVVHPIPAEIFGQFLERPSWYFETGPEGVCDERGELPRGTKAMLAGLHASVVRFPGGSDIDYMDWTDLADFPGRPRALLSIGHLGGCVSNRFGYPEYFRLSSEMGWKTVLVANLRQALYKNKSLCASADDAAELLRYSNRFLRRDQIAAMQIGNEGWFYWPPNEEAAKEIGITSPDAAAVWLRECLVAYADRLHAVDSSITLIADAPRPIDGGGGENGSGYVWRTAVDAPIVRSRYQLLAAHAYAPMGCYGVDRNGETLDPSSLSEDEVWYAAVSTLGRYDDLGQAQADWVAYNEIKSLGYGAAVTEWNWNSWNLKSMFPQITFEDGLPSALGASGFLHGLMRQEHVSLATQSMMLGTSWGITSVRIGTDNESWYLPQGEAFRLHAAHHGNVLMESSLAGNSFVEFPVRLAKWWPQVSRIGLVDAVVSADEKNFYVHLLNRSRSQPIALMVELPGIADRSCRAIFYSLQGTPEVSTKSGKGMFLLESQLEWNGEGIKFEVSSASMGVLLVPKIIKTSRSLK